MLCFLAIFLFACTKASEEQITKGTNDEPVLPSFDCSSVKKNSAEALVCNNESLVVLDIQLSEIELLARKVANESSQPSMSLESLKKLTSNFLMRRDQCAAKEERSIDCLRELYQQQDARVQIRWGLVEALESPVDYACAADNQIVWMHVRFYDTTPPAVRVSNESTHDRIGVLSSQQTNSALYRGRLFDFQTQENEARIRFLGDEPLTLQCSVVLQD